MRKKEKWLLFVMPSLVKMRLSRLVSRDNRIIYNVFPLPMPRAKRRAFQIVLPQKSCRTSYAAALPMPGLFLDADGAYRAALAAVTACGTSSGGMGPGSATARTPSMRNTAGHSPAHWYSRCTVQGLRMRSCKHLLAESIARFAANYAYASGLRCGTIRPPETGRRREDEYPDLWHEQVL